MTESVFQLKWNWRTGVWPRGAQVRTRWGLSLNPLSSTKTIVCPRLLAFFLAPASAHVSSGGSLLRCVPAPDARAAAASNSTPARSSRRARWSTGPYTRAGSGPPPARRSRDWCGIPGPPARASSPSQCAGDRPPTAAAAGPRGTPASTLGVRLGPTSAPSGSPTGDAPRRGAPLPPRARSAARAARLACVAALTSPDRVSFRLDVPCRGVYTKYPRMSLYYVILFNRLLLGGREE